MNIFIYNKNNLLIEGTPVVPNFQEFQENPIKFFPEWDIDNNIASETQFSDPILKGETISEKSREEQILLDNRLELLQDGEYLENGNIIIVPIPENFFIKKWNKSENIWIEGATQDQIKKRIVEIEDELMKLEANINLRLSKKYFVEEKQEEYKKLKVEKDNLLLKLI